MVKILSILACLAFLLTGCRHVSITVIPSDADILVNGRQLPASSRLTILPFTAKHAVISAKGCLPAETTVDYSTPPDVQLILNRQISVDSLPPQTDVFMNDKLLGQTPFTFELPANQSDVTLTFKKERFSSQTVNFSPATASQPIYAKLVPDQPGFSFWTLQPSKHGRAMLVANTVRTEKTSSEPGNRQPVPIVQLSGKQLQILDFTLLPEQGGILASVLVQTQEAPPEREVRIVIFPFSPKEKPTVLTHGNIDLSPTPMSDGEHALFTSNRTGRLDLWKCNLKTNVPQKLSLIHSSELIMYGPKCRPHNPQSQSQGENVLVTAYQIDTLNMPQIWSFAIDRQKYVTPELFCQGSDPDWSPSGRRIAFQKGSPSTLWRIESDGSLLKQLSPQNSLASFTHPAWSPDGRRIAFAANINSPQSSDDTDIWIMDADGGNLTQVTGSRALDDMPAWAPDGKSIFFRSNRNLHWGIWNIQVP